MNHEPTIKHVPNALFPRTEYNRRHWAPGWRLICSCGAKGVMRHTEEEARVDRAFHGTSVQVGETPVVPF